MKSVIIIVILFVALFYTVHQAERYEKEKLTPFLEECQTRLELYKEINNELIKRIE